jgi:hypothetical protein
VPDLARAPGTVTRTEIDTLLGQSLRSDRVTISTDGRFHHPVEYTTDKVIADHSVDVVDPDKANALLDAGATIVLANAELWIPQAIEAAARLAEDFGCEAQTHLFITGAQRSGLVPQADGEDNFLIQLSGSKTWSIWRPDGVAARRIEPETLGEPTTVATLTPGDVLYIPVGWVHSALAGSAGSAHITYQIVPVSLLDAVLDQLADELEPLLTNRLLPVPTAPALPGHNVADLARQVVTMLGLDPSRELGQADLHRAQSE